jgi:hypothetical protein
MKITATILVAYMKQDQEFAELIHLCPAKMKSVMQIKKKYSGSHHKF